jgi:uncharacterized repeat protein (TIGR02543 family)
MSSGEVGEVGQHVFLLRFTPTDTNFYIVSNIEVTITVIQAIPDFERLTMFTATYGDLVLSLELPELDWGFWTWEHPETFVGDAGLQIIYATFTPGDAKNYRTMQHQEIEVWVNRASPNIILPVLTAVFGTNVEDIELPDEQWSWISSGPVGYVGPREFILKFTPDNPNFYEVDDIKVTVTVTPARPTFDVPEGLEATYGDLISSVVLPGVNWSWQSVGSVGNAGEQTFLAIFTPSSTNYETVDNIEVKVLVKPANPEFDQARVYTYILGQQLGALSALLDHEVAHHPTLFTIVDGSFAFENVTTTPGLGVGQVTVVFTSNDANYNSATFQLNITVRYAVIIWMGHNGEIYRENYSYGETPEYDTTTYGIPQRTPSNTFTFPFIGWGEIVPVEGDATYTAEWGMEARIYEVVWMVGTEVFYTSFLQFTHPVTPPSANPAAPSPTQQFNFAFKGWNSTYTGYNGETLTVFPTNPVDGLVYFAIFYQNTNSYTITFNSRGGDSVEEITREYGVSVGAPIDPERVGYDFVAWFSDSGLLNEVSWPFTILEDVTFYAKWEARVFTITLSNENIPLTTSTIYLKYDTGWYSDSAATIPITSVTRPTFTGVFNGYYTEREGAGERIICPEGIIIGALDRFSTHVTLYAFWSSKISVTVPGNPADLTYTGAAQTPNIPMSSYYDIVVTARTNVGEYLATLILRTPDTHVWANGETENITLTWHIRPVVLTVTADDLSRPFGQVNPTLTYRVTGFVNGENVNVISGNFNISTTADVNSPVMAGGYPITIVRGGATATNYTFNFVEGTLTITRATPAAVVFPTATTITYDPVRQLSSVPFVGGSGDGEFVWTVGITIPTVAVTSYSVTFIPRDADNFDYTGITLTQNINLTVLRANPVITVWPSAGMVTFSPTLTLAGVSLSGGSATPNGTFNWTNSEIIPQHSNMGYEVTFRVDGPDADNYNIITSTIGLIVNKADPTVNNWPTTNPVTFSPTLTLNGVMLNGGLGTPAGIFSWVSGSTVPQNGNEGYDVEFKVDGDYAGNYNTLTQRVLLTVNRANPTVNSWPTATAVTFSPTLTLAGVMLSGGLATPIGDFTWTDNTIVPQHGNSGYQVTFTVTGDNAHNYNQLTHTVIVTVGKINPTVSTWPTTTAVTFSPTLTLAGVTLSGGSATPTGNFTWSDTAIVPQYGNGGYLVTFTVEGADAHNYNQLTHIVALIVNKANPTVNNWPTTIAITYSPTLTLSGVALNGGSGTPSGTFRWVTPTTVPQHGNEGYYVEFIVDGDYAGNYNILTQIVTLIVNKANIDMSGVIFADRVIVYDGLPQSIFATNLPAGVNVLNYDNNGRVNAGTYTITVHFSVSDSNNYNTPASRTATLTITRGSIDMSGVTFANRTEIYTGSPFSILATGVPAGVTVSYDGNGQVNVGTYTITATFTSEDPNIDPTTRTATLIINKANPVMNAQVGTYTLTFGQALSVLNSILATEGANVPGTFAFRTPAAVLNAGINVEVDVVFTPTDSANYNEGNLKVTVTINRAVIDMSGIKFENDTVKANFFRSFGLAVDYSTLPEGVEVEYANNNQRNAGEHIITVTFRSTNPNFEISEEFRTRTAILTIEPSDGEEWIIVGVGAAVALVLIIIFANYIKRNLRKRGGGSSGGSVKKAEPKKKKVIVDDDPYSDWADDEIPKW